MTIWKYELELTAVQMIAMPRNAWLLTVQIQRGKPCLWVLIDENDDRKEQRLIRTLGTGHLIPDDAPGDYISTYQIVGGDLVFHVFDGGPQ